MIKFLKSFFNKKEASVNFLPKKEAREIATKSELIKIYERISSSANSGYISTSLTIEFSSNVEHLKINGYSVQKHEVYNSYNISWGE